MLHQIKTQQFRTDLLCPRFESLQNIVKLKDISRVLVIFQYFSRQCLFLRPLYIQGLFKKTLNTQGLFKKFPLYSSTDPENILLPLCPRQEYFTPVF